ncbi:MAG: nucleoside-diphosphate kinase [Candidatus Hodarchaeota archaeon]
MTVEILVIAKPDLVIRRGAGARMLKAFLELTSGRILCSSELTIPARIAEAHYAHLEEKGFYRWLLSYISCYKSFVFILRTAQPITRIREELGGTIVETDSQTSLRYRFGLADGMNGLHISESEETARKEIENWMRFGIIKRKAMKSDLHSYIEKYLRAPDNTKRIHDLLSRKGRNSLFSTLPAYSHTLFDLIQEEAIDVSLETVKHFYDLILEGISLHS